MVFSLNAQSARLRLRTRASMEACASRRSRAFASRGTAPRFGGSTRSLGASRSATSGTPKNAPAPTTATSACVRSRRSSSSRESSTRPGSAARAEIGAPRSAARGERPARVRNRRRRRRRRRRPRASPPRTRTPRAPRAPARAGLALSRPAARAAERRFRTGGDWFCEAFPFSCGPALGPPARRPALSAISVFSPRRSPRSCRRAGALRRRTPPNGTA